MACSGCARRKAYLKKIANKVWEATKTNGAISILKKSKSTKTKI